jgi:hypothetical protein
MAEPTGTKFFATMLRERSARELGDVAMFPVSRTGGRTWNYYAGQLDISVGDRIVTFWVRSPGTPFDIVPLRTNDPARLGCWFSIGDDFLARPASWQDMAKLLLLQVELQAPERAMSAMDEYLELCLSVGARVVSRGEPEATPLGAKVCAAAYLWPAAPADSGL